MKKRVILSFLAAMSLTVCGFAQSLRVHGGCPAGEAPGERAEASAPIVWRGSARMTSATEGVITLTAMMQKGWHLYGMQMPADGPQSTVVKFEPQNGVAYVGKLKVNKAPIKKMEEMFGTEVEFWEDTVTFTRKFKLSSKKVDLKPIVVSVSFMGCNDETCLPPSTKELRINVKK